MSNVKYLTYTQDQDMIDRALDEARTNNVFANLGSKEPELQEPDTWQPIGGVVGAIVDKAKQARDNYKLAQFVGYEDDDLDEWLF